jgi:hypothetical protein
MKQRQTIQDLPTAASDAGRSECAELTGTVHGSAEVDEGCVWLGLDDGERIPLVWPAGYQVRFNPPPHSRRSPLFELRDNAEAWLLQDGHRVSLSGSYVQVDPAGRCMLGRSEAYRVDDVVIHAVPL